MVATNLQKAELVEVFKEVGKKQIWQKNDYIIGPNQQPPGIFYIDSGLVKAYDLTKYNEENLLIVRKSNEIFPLIWAITGQERSVIYQALDKTITWRIERSDFLKLLEDNKSIMNRILDMTVEMYRLHSERILNLEYRTVRERIISFLFTMSRRFGIETDEGIKIELPLRHQDIASSVNSSRETTSREIGGLSKKGLIEHKRTYILLKKPDELRKFIN